jgi:hypothetical protein
MGTASAIYRIVLLLHIATAIVGFGGLLVNGINNARAFRAPVDQAKTLLHATQNVSKTAYYAIYALFALGIVLVAVSDSAFSFSAPWISAAFLVVFAIIGISHGMVRPAIAGLVGRADALAAAAPGQSMPILESDGEAGSLAKRLALGEGLIQLLLVVALFLMIWQPGN